MGAGRENLEMTLKMFGEKSKRSKGTVIAAPTEIAKVWLKKDAEFCTKIRQC